ncbi:TadA family conjugal transfer-associated ATPase [Kineosporia succinea]|uniref:Pilus assembly protein CpaF n=1 Tax=Kineosporia succinea TaxID=84632 RepID=A0ABT9P1E0_9ACTN|nr:TadA family conjugal transfer-associated ATPase [Kineosporia succinea]MDP9826035.1 pilus assembly protein CpaF [Kineosporia succinea]
MNRPGDGETALVSRLRGGLAGSGRPDRRELAALVAATSAGLGQVLGQDDVLAATERVSAELWGLGPLQPFLELPGVTDVLVNGPGEIWVDRGSGLTRVACPAALSAETQVRALATRLASTAGRRLDDAAPYADARLDGGIRLHAVIPPVSPGGTLISLRVLQQEPLTLETLVSTGSMPARWAEVLRAMIAARAAFLVSGGTGAGKTTLLASLLSLVPARERIVLVEDVGELRPAHPHLVRLEARHANVEGAGAVPLEVLVRQALRMRPDRVVVGECRGAEVRDLLAALNTGHAGGCGTVHANAPADVPARLEALGALAGLTVDAVRAQAAAALDAVVHVERRGNRRQVTQIAVARRGERGELTMLPALTADPRDPSSDGSLGAGWPDLAARLDCEGRA